MEFQQFSFCGMERFERVRDKLYAFLSPSLPMDDYDFQQAVEEAVENAGRYSVDGPFKARICIKARLTDTDAAVTVLSKTTPFDALAYQKKLQRLLENPETRNMSWGDYVGTSLESSGFWYMLTGCDYLYVEANGQSVTLVKSFLHPSDEESVTRISALVPRFLVKRNGVIL